MFGVARLSLRDAIDFKSDTPGKFNPGLAACLWQRDKAIGLFRELQYLKLQVNAGIFSKIIRTCQHVARVTDVKEVTTVKFGFNVWGCVVGVNPPTC
ncbi:hypothetical protein AZH46_10015 [Corynebacterium striatum]|nr:hypothetical protein AZH46_10015 [Corynebacterium striatum]